MKSEIIAGISTMVVIAIMFIPLVFDSQAKEQTRREAIQAGLQECPNPNNVGPRIIWQKQCEKE